MLIPKIIPFMFILGRNKGVEHGIKGQCVLVRADLKKIRKYFQDILSDKSAVFKQVIRPTAVNNALRKLKEVNRFYKDVIIVNQWQEVDKKSDSVLWNFLTNENTV